MASLTPMREVLSNRQFALLWGGQTVSQFGDGIISVALPLLVLAITKNATDLGLVVAARLVPTVVFLLLGGAVTDRVSRRLAMLTSDASRAAITASLGVLALSGSLNLTELLVGSILFGIFDALFYPASTALLPELIAPAQLTSGNSLSRFSNALAGGLIGPLAGGVIASTIGTSWSLIIDAGTFVVSAGCLLAMRSTPRPEASGTSMVSEIGEGLSYCRRTPWIIWSIGMAGIANDGPTHPQTARPNDVAGMECSATTRGPLRSRADCMDRHNLRLCCWHLVDGGQHSLGVPHAIGGAEGGTGTGLVG